jgi:hypothetical protein
MAEWRWSCVEQGGERRMQRGPAGLLEAMAVA